MGNVSIGIHISVTIACMVGIVGIVITFFKVYWYDDSLERLEKSKKLIISITNKIAEVSEKLSREKLIK